MRNVLLIFAGLLVISGITSANLWHQLRAERRLTADLHAQLTEARALSRVATPTGPRVSTEVPPVITAGAAPAARAIEMPPANVRPPAADAMRQMKQESDSRQAPEYRRARLAEMRMRVEQNYPGLVEELGLSGEEAERLFNVLAEARLNLESVGAVGANGQPDAQESSRRLQALQRQQEESLAALLGTARYSRWQNYQKTGLARMEAVDMGTQLARLGQPLSSTQQKSLVTAVIAEQERTREDRERMAEGMARSFNSGNPQAVALLQQEAASLQEQSNRRILEAMGSSLDARQLDLLRRQFEVKDGLDRAAVGIPGGRP